MKTPETCRDYEPLLVRAADAAVEPGSADQARLDAHLEACANCRTALADQRAVREAFAARPVQYATPGFPAAVMRAIEADRSWLRWVDFRQWTWRLAPVAAALLVATWVVLQQGVTDTSTVPVEDDLPVSAALWQDSVSDVSVLALMVLAGPDDRLSDSIKER
jgi:predicted anti-sigma-YlaC factor YlaD